MTEQRICIPVNADGTIQGRLGQAHAVATCTVDDSGVRDWVEHTVNWDWTYGVDVPGVNHPRVIRFLQAHQVDVVVADEICPGVERTLGVLGIDVRAHRTGMARDLVLDSAA
mgnify:FL=1